jgi:hypothetical protein
MAEFRYRKRFNEKEWKKKVDISTIFNLKKATAEIRKLAERKKPFGVSEIFDRIIQEVVTLENNLAVANGDVKIFELKEHELPEDSQKTKYRKTARRKKAA